MVDFLAIGGLPPSEKFLWALICGCQLSSRGSDGSYWMKPACIVHWAFEQLQGCDYASTRSHKVFYKRSVSKVCTKQFVYDTRKLEAKSRCHFLCFHLVHQTVTSNYVSAFITVIRVHTSAAAAASHNMDISCNRFME